MGALHPHVQESSVKEMQRQTEELGTSDELRGAVNERKVAYGGV